MSEFTVTVTPPFENIGKAFLKIAEGMKLQTALKELAYRTEREVKAVTPVDTGRLRASIFTSIGNLEAVIKPNVYYDVFVHEGTYKMRARPFLEWGWEAIEAQGLDEDIFVGEVERLVERNLKTL